MMLLSEAERDRLLVFLTAEPLVLGPQFGGCGRHDCGRSRAPRDVTMR